MASGRKIVVNGINGATGNYDFPPMTLAAFAQTLKATRATPPAHVTQRGRQLRRRSFARGLPFGTAPDDLRQAGWGVVFHRDERSEVRNALAPLIARRRTVVGDAARVKELAYHPGEDATSWLRRHGVSWNNVEPTQIPYYLLWVGSPELSRSYSST